jgi:hypothetical protein
MPTGTTTTTTAGPAILIVRWDEVRAGDQVLFAGDLYPVAAIARIEPDQVRVWLTGWDKSRVLPAGRHTAVRRPGCGHPSWQRRTPGRTRWDVCDDCAAARVVCEDIPACPVCHGTGTHPWQEAQA